MLEVIGRKKPPIKHKAGKVVLRPSLPKIGSRYVKPVATWQTTITPDQLWIQNIYLNQPVSQWTWTGRWRNVLHVLFSVAVVYIFYHAGRWVHAGMPMGY